MNKKLPNIYKGENNINSNNKKSYYSFSNNIKKEEKEKEYIKPFNADNFFNYFNKIVIIELMSGEIINTKILSKLGDRVLLENGNYLELDKIKNIK